ncbi:MAG: YqeG family HAD IIIA-type phosphatase [Oscillospiraceae bacterium]|nr:YqeG family HAD IIIA-type phosphatase [Oscillospiraceae bacterium]
MSFSFLPTIMIGSITQLTPAYLQSRGIELLMLDFDNTIVPYTTSTPTEEMANWLRTMATSEIRVCIVSNSKKPRVKVFCKEYGLDCITHAKKPFTKGIRACMEKYQKAPSQCALAGDQIYTDTLGGNSAGVQSVLVKAIHNHNIWLKLRHVAEMPFILCASKRRVNL